MKNWVPAADDQAEDNPEDRLETARSALRIRLRDHDCEDASTAEDAERRYRKTLERAFGGPDEAVAALRAYQLACDNDPEDIDPTDRVSAQAWLKASQRASTEGLVGLDGAHEAWFEVSVSKSPPALCPMVPRRPAIAAVAPRLLYVAPPPAELPTDLFPVQPSAVPQVAAACEKPAARNRIRTRVAEPLMSPQLDLF